MKAWVGKKHFENSREPPGHPGPSAIGGGAQSCTLNNCIITRNSAFSAGGGVHTGSLKNCALSDNVAVANASLGGGAYSATLNNCTVSGNRASASGGGVSKSTLTNSIVYDNQAPAGSNYDSSTLYYCCTAPLPPDGIGNIGANPELASATHVSAISPCIGKGTPNVASDVDIDGEPWATPPSIGCDEYYSGSVTGALSVAIGAPYTYVATGSSAGFEALISGRTTGSSWDFGDGTVISNRPHADHAWTNTGAYAVVLRAFNESFPTGISATVIVHAASQPVHCVALGNPTPVPPYSSWETAATNIEDAINVAEVGATVLVSNGVYQTGGRIIYGALTNRVAVTKPLLIQSVNGLSVTTIQGFQVPGSLNGDSAVRCVYLTNGATLSGFTLTGGATRAGGDTETERAGGGVWCEGTNATVSNCMIYGNTAGLTGGGAYLGTLNTCSVIQNSAGSGLNISSGGGAMFCTLNRCTLNGNRASVGGGAANATLNYCTLSGNSVSSGGGGVIGCTLYQCTLTRNSAAYGGGAESSTLNACRLYGNTAVNGGGADSSLLNNCILTSNSANNPGIAGGGAFSSVLNNCTISANSASGAGGVGNCTLTNSIVYNNVAGDSPNYFGSSFDHCCTTPLPDGAGNFDNPPLFVNGTSDLHLQSNSPCINAGRNSAVLGTTDFAGNPRVSGGTVDMGAYEFQSPASVISYAWLQSYGLPTDGSADYTDPDRDGMNNWQEWVAGTNPTNAGSVLRMLSAKPTGTTNVVVTWSSASTRAYSLVRATNFLAVPAFSVVWSNIAGLADTTSFVDTNPPADPAAFYRVIVQPP